MSSTKPKQTSLDWLVIFEALVMKHLSDTKLTNAFLASQLSISERKLYRLLRQSTGQSPNHYIRHIRLAKAHEFLGSGDYKTVKAVATKVGFKKVDYFSQLFKLAFGYTPFSLLKIKMK